MKIPVLLGTALLTSRTEALLGRDNDKIVCLGICDLYDERDPTKLTRVNFSNFKTNCPKWVADPNETDYRKLKDWCQDARDDLDNTLPSPKSQQGGPNQNQQQGSGNANANDVVSLSLTMVLVGLGMNFL